MQKTDHELLNSFHDDLFHAPIEPKAAKRTKREISKRAEPGIWLPRAQTDVT